MKRKKNRAGKRIDMYQKKRRTYGEYSKTQAQAAPKEGGKRVERTSRRESRQLRQLVVSAAILVSVIAVKLFSPQTLEPVRAELLRLMGTDTDIAAVFSAVGRTVGAGEDLGQVINDACVAVFGTELPGGEAKSAAELPEDAYMMQQVLGFAYAAPLEGNITDVFGLRADTGEFHYGLDLEAGKGTVIRSFAAGTVTAVGESSTLGKYVTVAHENGYATLYAHCSRITASSGQQVQMSDPIAEVGETGRATGPHLHFELYRDSLYLNPIYYVAS